jgi:multidrug efflux system membrane fusion protein
MRRHLKTALLRVLIAGALWLGAAPALVAAADEPAIPVTAGQVETRDVPIWLSGIGSVQPLNAVTVKVRVDGQLNRVAFTEGQDVRAGDLLAEIDPRPYRAALKQAQANQAKDEAQLSFARIDLARYVKLETTGATPVRTVDTQKSQVASLEATVQADQAAVEMAQLQLEFTRITSPLDGRAGLRLVDPGSIVHATDAVGLVTITQMQPISSLFTLAQDELPDVLSAMAEGTTPTVAYARDNQRQLAMGKLVFIDSQVDQATGQVRLKALFDNADRSLWPGEFITARVQVKTIKGATVIPARAVQRGQTGTYVFTIKPDNTVELRPMSVSQVSDGLAIVASGLAPGERVVLDGQYRLQPGARVDAHAPSAGASP